MANVYAFMHVLQVYFLSRVYLSLVCYADDFTCIKVVLQLTAHETNMCTAPRGLKIQVGQVCTSAYNNMIVYISLYVIKTYM